MGKIRVHNLVLPNKPLSNRELERAIAALGIPNFRGVFMRDSLPSSPRHKECGILNHDDRNGPGTHWTCWYKNRGMKVYFDPYGLPPPAEMVEYLEPEIRYNTDELQQRGTVVCGHFCLHVLKELSDGRPFDEAVFSLMPLNK